MEAKHMTCLDLIVTDYEAVEIEVQMRTGDGRKVLYVHVNGITVLRVGRIMQLMLTGPNDTKPKEL